MTTQTWSAVHLPPLSRYHEYSSLYRVICCSCQHVSAASSETQAAGILITIGRSTEFGRCYACNISSFCRKPANRQLSCPISGQLTPSPPSCGLDRELRGKLHVLLVFGIHGAQMSVLWHHNQQLQTRSARSQHRNLGPCCTGISSAI